MVGAGVEHEGEADRLFWISFATVNHPTDRNDTV
jgi:hypothetical protein